MSPFRSIRGALVAIVAVCIMMTACIVGLKLYSSGLQQQLDTEIAELSNRREAAASAARAISRAAIGLGLLGNDIELAERRQCMQFSDVAMAQFLNSIKSIRSFIGSLADDQRESFRTSLRLIEQSRGEIRGELSKKNPDVPVFAFHAIRAAAHIAKVSGLMAAIDEQASFKLQRAIRAARDTSRQSDRWFIGVLIAWCVIFVLSLSFIYVRLVLRPLRSTAASVLKLAGGDIDAEPDGIARRDEIGWIQDSLVTLRESMRERRALAREKDAFLNELNHRQKIVDGAINNFNDGIRRLAERNRDRIATMSESTLQIDESTKDADSQAASVSGFARKTEVNVMRAQRCLM